MRRSNKGVQIVWALLLVAIFGQGVSADTVRNKAYASGTKKIAEMISLGIDIPVHHMASADADTETKKTEIEYSGEYSGKGFTGKEQELWSHEYALDELESEKSKILDEQHKFFKEYHAAADKSHRLFTLKTQMRKQGRPAAELEEIEPQIREIHVQMDRLDVKINEFEPSLQKLEQEIAKVKKWILDVKVTVDDSENYINELYDRRILIRPNNKAKYEQERNTWLKLKNKPRGKGPRQKGKGGASVS